MKQKYLIIPATLKESLTNWDDILPILKELQIEMGGKKLQMALKLKPTKDW